MPTGAYYPAGGVTPNVWDTFDFDTTTNFAGITDFTAATQAAIDAASVSGTGGDVYLPPGVIRLNGVTINAGGVNLVGCGWEEYTTGGAYPFAQRGKRGTYVITDNPAVSTVTLGPLAANNRIADIAFLQPHAQDSPGWVPTVFAPTILQQGPNSGSFQIEDILFWGCYEGIRLGTVSNAVGRVTIRDVFAACYSSGITVTNCTDILVLDNCNFYPQVLAGSPATQFWIQNRATFINLVQCTKPILSNISAKNCLNGISLSSVNPAGGAGFSATPPQRIKIVGADLDGVIFGLIENGINCNVKASGLFCSGAKLATPGFVPRPPQTAGNLYGSIGIWSVGLGAVFDVCDFHGTAYEGPAVVISTNGDVRFGINCWFDNWNINPAYVNSILASSPNPAPAVLCLVGCNAWVSNNSRFTNANGGAQTGGAGTVTRY